ncbi:MAG: hypothetical protein H0X30_37060, partial [Anaerolineae bacterium]|nr:hypothetical protein [Anaerolineae bacterium]
LHTVAKSTVENASDRVKQILSDFKYDKEWLDDPDGDNSQAYLWYTINLMSILKPCPSLSNNRFRHSHLILEKVLPTIGWSNKDVQKLIFGNSSIVQLLDTADEQALFVNLSLLGGCLAVHEIQIMLLHLEEASEQFHAPSPLITNWMQEFIENSNLSQTDVLKMAYFDCQDMLKTALQRHEALYLHRDA